MQMESEKEGPWVVIARLGPLSVTVSLERSHKPHKDDGPHTKFLWFENTARDIKRKPLETTVAPEYVQFMWAAKERSHKAK